MIAILFAAALVAQSPAATPLPAAERLAAAQAAGFRVRGGIVINECDVPADSLTFDRQDLNGDRVAELVVSDSSICYGGAGTTFSILRKVGGRWVAVLSAIGMMTPLKTRHGGWQDIEIGGPGFRRMPVAKWNGARYVY